MRRPHCRSAELRGVPAATEIVLPASACAHQSWRRCLPSFMGFSFGGENAALRTRESPTASALGMLSLRGCSFQCYPPQGRDRLLLLGRKRCLFTAACVFAHDSQPSSPAMQRSMCFAHAGLSACLGQYRARTNVLQEGLDGIDDALRLSDGSRRQAKSGMEIGDDSSGPVFSDDLPL